MKIGRKLQRNLTGYLFIAPNMLGFLVLLAAPILFSLAIGFTTWDYTRGVGGITFNYGRNFIDMWHDDWFVRSLINTLYFSIGTVPLSVFLALVAASVIDKYVVNITAVKLMFILPFISNVVAVSIVWVMMLSNAGPITLTVKSLGVAEPPKWLGDAAWAMPAIMLMSVWMLIGFLVLIYTAALQSIPESLYEAADIDGANGINKFFNITVPLLRPTTFFLLIITMINSFKVFGQINIMTRGGPGDATNVLVYYIYTSAFSFFDMGYASSMSIVMFVILFAITLFQWQGQKKWARDF